MQDGILNKQDYALLFENKEEKHHIPVEATEQLNLYNEVVFTSAVLETITRENIRLALFNKYGDLLGYYLPNGYLQDSKTVLAQCLLYSDLKKRLKIAKSMEISSIHNLRSNLRYYKKQNEKMAESIETLTDGIRKINEAKSVDDIMLIEGRCRQLYYQAFNEILKDDDFHFDQRTRQPPEDPINALISFGNTLLYNRVQQVIWRTSLDSRIGIIHAANRRHLSLNLDFADLFKPILVDRVIFTLINKKQISKGDFEYHQDGGVFLNEKGKRIFIESFEEKFRSRLTIHDRRITYQQLLETEIRTYLKYILEGTEYKPYKYY